MSEAYDPLSRVRRFLLAETRAIRWWSLVVAAELALVTAYVAVTGVIITEPRYIVYPFVWINLGLSAMVRTDLPGVDGRKRWFARALAAGYFLLLAWAGGIL
ncbi:MAG: hypothetical protein ABEH58_07095, partial [Haloplanus sp.]